MSGLGGRTASFKDLASGGSTSAPDQRPRAIPGMGSKVMSFGTLSADAATEESRRELMWQLMSSYLPRDVESIQRYIVNHIEYSLARTRYNFDNYGCYQATALSVRDRLIETFNDTKQFFDEANPKMCYYLSMEFLMGRSLQNALYNLGLKDKYSEALTQLGFQLEDLYELEKDAALGNGGLGRLAACFLDSMATQNYPAWGYGIRYKYGMFKQGIMDGYQIEGPDYWLQNGNPWEVPRLDLVYPVRFYGTVRQERGRAVWEGGEIVEALAYDNPIPGYDTYNCINLRLWSGKPGKEFDLASFNEGDYVKAIEAKQRSENISSVLYPNDHTDQGKELRLRQQYFFVSATLQDVIKRFKGRYQSNPNWKEFPTKVAIQLNDTHPTIGIPELMRILMDLEGLSWDEAWAITEATFGYTNHTVLPEALEKWSVPLFQSLLPRHLQIIYDINWKLMQAVQARYPRDYDRMSRMSIIEEGDTKSIRMANLAVVGSHATNGVAALHSELVKKNLFPDFVEFYGAQRFQNKTNGVTPRRWLQQINPALTATISKWLGTSQWVANLELLAGLRKFQDNKDLQKEFEDAKREAKVKLAAYIEKANGVKVSPDALFDVQVKRIHEYKRQLLNILGIIARYNKIKSMSPQDRKNIQPKVCILGGKAAPGYYMAKLIIKLANGVGKLVNNDPDVGDLLKVVFLANYNVSLASVIIPANDISEHISTAGTEASGTSNMKFVMNGGLIIGTLDGANIEIREEGGDDTMFIFGLLTEKVAEAQHKMRFDPPPMDGRLRKALDQIQSGMWGPIDKLQPILDIFNNRNDNYIVAADFASYMDAQDEIDKTYKNKAEWYRRTIKAVSGMGKFSSDRTIHEYAKDIWGIEQTPFNPSNIVYRKPQWSDSADNLAGLVGGMRT
eukprot:tig00020964_g16797.t1